LFFKVMLSKIGRSHYYLYGKREARSRRKMDLFTVLGDTIDGALKDALAIRQVLGIGNY